MIFNKRDISNAQKAKNSRNVNEWLDAIDGSSESWAIFCEQMDTMRAQTSYQRQLNFVNASIALGLQIHEQKIKELPNAT